MPTVRRRRADGSARIVLERLRSGEPWSFAIRFDDGASQAIALAGCPARAGEYEPMENVHVVLAPH